MLIYNGHTICEGISEGRIKLCIHDFNREILSVEKINPASEIKRFEDAVFLTLNSIKSECEKIKSDGEKSGSLSETDETVLKILESYRMILEDDEFKTMVLENIKESGLPLEKSLEKTRDFFIDTLSGNGEVFSSRTNDVYDLTDRLFHSLSHEEKNKIIIPKKDESKENLILLTDSMSVSDVLKYDRGKIAGIVSMRDSKYSHAAILAKSMNAVMVTGIKFKKDDDLKMYENAYAAIDGYEGKIYIEPDEDTLISLRKKKEKKAAFFNTDGKNGEVNEDKKNKNEKADKYQDGNNCKANQDNKNNKSDKGNQENLNSNKDKGNQDNQNNNKDKGNQDNQNSNNTMNENMTTDKTKRIKIYANICGMNCVNEAVKFKPDGIGLFRTEYLFMNASKPGEDEQFEVYKAILEKMNPLPVIIRTVDLGADKNAPFLNLEPEDNPSMGLRGIRLCLNKPKLFKTQLRALLRAGVYGNLSVMFPMITSVNEVKKIKAITEEIKAKLTKENIPFAENIRFGVMIETPAAVMVADELAKEADFFSIGTNDLTQYTLAMDRTNPSLEEFYDTHSPAVLKMIRMTAKAAKENNIPVGICGELAADTSLTEEFIRMGIDELSVAIPQIAEMKKKQ